MLFLSKKNYSGLLYFFAGLLFITKGVAQEARTSIIFALAPVRAVLLDEYVRRSPPLLHQHDTADSAVRTTYRACD